jgi:hypothetical protein
MCSTLGTLSARASGAAMSIALMVSDRPLGRSVSSHPARGISNFSIADACAFQEENRSAHCRTGRTAHEVAAQFVRLPFFDDVTSTASSGEAEAASRRGGRTADEDLGAAAGPEMTRAPKFAMPSVDRPPNVRGRLPPPSGESNSACTGRGHQGPWSAPRMRSPTVTPWALSGCT